MWSDGSRNSGGHRRNSVDSLQHPASAIRAVGRYALVRLDPDTKYQRSASGIVLGESDIERPPCLTGVVLSHGESYVRECEKPGGGVRLERRHCPYSVGERVSVPRGEGYQAWWEDGVDADGAPVRTEYRIVDWDNQLLGFVLEGEATNVRIALVGQSGEMI